jgi:tetratricopeptide (TPR) repeat protein/predicted Ser/Thr protein kinase
MPDGEPTFGRYVVRAILGSGRSGVVYRAYDPELRREIALKMLRARRSDSDDRVLREAQTAARIRHLNVVTIYDVGTIDDHVFLAMELVEGTTLDEWLEKPRSLAEVLRVFRGAGEGLQAAHQAGVVHRNLKPRNVLIGDDGRICVTDFGLAGAIVDVSPYLAPEQARGGAIDARADQFSFCVALLEALYGKLPRTADGFNFRTEVEQRLRRGATASLRRLLRRGLQPEAAARFSHMGELLRLLAPRRRGRLVALVAALSVLLMASVVLPRKHGRDQINRCRQAESRIATFWGTAQYSLLQSALAAAQLNSSWPTVKEALDGWARDWTRLHAETCELAARPETAGLFDLRMECLNRRWQEANELLTLLTTQPNTVKHATNAIAGLLSIDSCTEAALHRTTGPDVTAEARRPLDTLLARGSANYSVENCREALTEAEQATEQARTLGATGLQSEAQILAGGSQKCLGDRNAARMSYMDAAVLAGQAQDDALLFTTYIRLVSLTTELSRYDEARHWLQLARDTLEAHPDVAPQKLVAQLELEDCHVTLTTGQMRAAEPHCIRAVELYHKLPTRPLPEADATEELGLLFGAEGRFAEADKAYRQARELCRQLNGPDSIDELRVLESMADNEFQQDHLTAALALERPVVERDTKTFPHRYAVHLTVYGRLLIELGRARESLPFLERAVAVSEQITGEHAYETGGARAVLGLAYVALGQPRQALAHLESAARIFPPNDDEELTAQIDIGLAKALWSTTPHRERALKLARQARDLLRANPLGPIRARHTRELEAWLTTHEN